MSTEKTDQQGINGAAHQRTITSLHTSKRGKVSNKWSSYLSYYDKLFDQIKDDPIKLFEIGVQNGGSLETWSNYFLNAKAIIGCDVDEKCSQLSFEDPRISVIIGNANSQPVYQSLVQKGPFDVIIDDGSHLSEDILVSFLNLFPMLIPGGLYVVEDTHAVYQRAATGIHNKRNVFGFFKELTDVVNYQFWHHEQSIENLLAQYFTVPIPNFLNQGWIESIEFRNSIVTTRKSHSSNLNSLGSINITGDVADVDPEPLRVKNALLKQNLK